MVGNVNSTVTTLDWMEQLQSPQDEAISQKPAGKGEKEVEAFGAQLMNATGMLQQMPAQAPKQGMQAMTAKADAPSQLEPSQSLLPKQPVGGMKADAAFAGLKPQFLSREWVFDQGMDRNNDLKPLFGDNQEATQVLDSMRPRGDAAAAMLESNPQGGMPQMPNKSEASQKPELPQKAELSQKPELPQKAELSQKPELPQKAELSRMPELPQKAELPQMQKLSQQFENPGFDQRAVMTDASDIAPALFEGAQIQSEVGPIRNRNALSSAKAPSAQVSGLSGSEFLNTLNTTRTQASAQKGAQSGLNDQSLGQQLSDGNRSLKAIDGGLKGKKSGFEEKLGLSRDVSHAAHLSGHKTDFSSAFAAPVTMTGHVTKGAMAHERLSSESLAGLSSNIRGFNAQGGGEIRMKLNPEHLGEVRIRVSTQGNRVGLEIQTADEGAKKVIEESIGHLRESLATHQLSLGQVDLAIAHSSAGAGSGDSRSGQEQSQQSQFGQSHSGFGDASGNQRGHNGSGHSFGGDSREWAGGEASQPRAIGGASARAPVMNAARSYASSGRIDVTA